MNKWKISYARLNYTQKKRLWIWLVVIFVFFTVFIGSTSWVLCNDKKIEDVYWYKYLYERDTLTRKEQNISKNATVVKTGVYIEDINDINIRSSNYKITFQVWFRWENFDSLNMLDNYEIYNGQIDSQQIIKNIDKDGTRYQLASVTATVAKNFWTTRFPLGTHQLRFYIEPKQGINGLVLQPDKENSSINENINVSGFNINRFATNVFIKEYENTKSNPETKEAATVTEFLASIELNRKSLGLYIKCFIALVGTLGWVLIVLFICTYHNTDPLSMIPGALFGTVSNILVGANLIPDAIYTGLLEFINILAILIILFSSFAIITINRQRTYYNDDEFASFFGKHIFWLIVFFAVTGNILIPLAAYKF